MYSPKISEQLIPILYKRAKDEGKPMTRLVNEILEADLYKTYFCSNCNAPIEAEAGTKEAFCEYCQSPVFLKVVKQ